MAQITIPDEMLLRIKQYAQENGKTQEEVVQEALTTMFSLHLNLLASDVVADMPPYGSAEEQQLLATVRERVGTQLAAQGISVADEVNRDRGE